MSERQKFRIAKKNIGQWSAACIYSPSRTYGGSMAAVDPFTLALDTLKAPAKNRT